MGTKRKEKIKISFVELVAIGTLFLIVICIGMAFINGDNHIVYRFKEWYPATDNYKINNTNPEVLTIRESNSEDAEALTLGRNLEFYVVGKKEGNAIVYFDILNDDGNTKASKIYHLYVDDKKNVTLNKLEVSTSFNFKKDEEQTHKIVVADDSALEISESELYDEESETDEKNYEVTAIMKKTSKTTIALEIDNPDGTVSDIKKYNVEMDENNNIWFYEI